MITLWMTDQRLRETTRRLPIYPMLPIMKSTATPVGCLHKTFVLRPKRRRVGSSQNFGECAGRPLQSGWVAASVVTIGMDAGR